MTIEEKLKDYILSRYKSVRQFVEQNNLSYSTVDSILRRGVNNSSMTTVFKLCNTLNISADELANNKIVPLDQKIQSRAQMTDLETILDFTRRNIQEYGDLTIGGEPLTENEMEMILDALDIGIGIIKRNRERNKK